MPRAIAHVAVIVACAMMIPVGLGGPAGAQVPTSSPSPSASPVPTPIAFTAHAHANVTVVTASATFNGSLQLGIAQRTNLTRIDVLDVKSDTIPIPPIGVTAVVDRAANTVTIWNDVTKQYAVQPFIPSSVASPTPRASASPRASAYRGPRPHVAVRQPRHPQRHDQAHGSHDDDRSAETGFS